MNVQQRKLLGQTLLQSAHSSFIQGVKELNNTLPASVIPVLTFRDFVEISRQFRTETQGSSTKTLG